MSRKTVRDVDSIYSGDGGNKRSRISDDISCWSNVTSAVRWTSILSCCWRRRNREEKPDFKEYNPNEWDYIVEKLVVKRVPLSFYATEKDIQEFLDDKKDKESSFGPIGIVPAGKEMRDKQVYSAMQSITSNSYFFKNKTRGDLSNEPSNKNLRFNRDEDLLDEDAAQAGPSNYNKNSRIIEANEYLNKFSSLHPDLKENERPPKDPNPLNPPAGSKRSLAENMSEIASAKKNLSANKFNNKKVKERMKQGSEVYITVSDDTSREISNLIGVEEIPTRDKHTSSICRKMGSKSCLPYPRKFSKTRQVEISEGKKNRQEVSLPNNNNNNNNNNEKKSSEKSKDRDFNSKSYKVPKFDVLHCVSSEHNSVNKLGKLNPCSGLTSREKKHDLELSNRASTVEDGLVTKSTSYTSDNCTKNENLAGTTLRWKIIIKHHQPTANDTAAVPVLTESSKLRTINDSLNRSKLTNAKTESFDKIITDDEMDYKNG